MPNLFLFADWITMESLRILINKSQVSQFFNTDYNKEFTREFAVGETVRVKLPQRFLIRDGMGYTPQAIERKYTTVTLDQMFGVDFEWDSAEKALKMERGEDAIRREYIEPAMSQIASEIESRCTLYAYQNTNNVVGSLGTTPVTMAPFHQARQRLNELSCPSGERGLIVSPGMMSTLTSTAANLTWTNPQAEISRVFKEGYYGRAAGFDWYESPALYDHTSGTKLTANAFTISAVPAQGATSVVGAGTAAQTFLKGDVVSFGTSWATQTGCRAVNPVTRRSTGTLKQFVVTQDLTVSGAAGDVLYFKPAIYGPGSPYQNVDALPIAATTTAISYPAQNVTASVHGINALALHGDAFALVGVKLETPKAVEIASQTRDPVTGLSVRFIRQFDAQTSKMVNRFDVLLGFGDLYADNCSCRVLSLL